MQYDSLCNFRFLTFQLNEPIFSLFPHVQIEGSFAYCGENKSIFRSGVKMKKLYIIILLFLITYGLNAQNKSSLQITPINKGGKTSYQKEIITPNFNKAAKKSIIPAKSKVNSTASINSGPYLALEGFETFLPTGWTNWTPTSGAWQQTSSQSNSGSNSAFVDGVPNSESWLVTSAIDLTGAIDPVLIFHNYFDDTFSSEYNDERIIKISTDYTNNGNPSSATWDEIPFDLYDFGVWYRKQILLSYYSDETIYIAFVYKGNGFGSINHGVDWYLDDVSVEEKTIEDFEDEFNFPPSGWSSNGYEWELGYDGYLSNYSAYAYFDPYDGPTQIERWLITPQIDLTLATTPGLKYYELVYPAEGGFGSHDVLISTDGGGSWFNIRNIINNEEWNLVELDLTPYAGNVVLIAFDYFFDSQGEEVYGSEWYIDDVSITNDGGCTGTEPLPDCATLQSPPDGATLYHNYAALFWSPPTNDATTQTLKVWKEVSGTPVTFYEDIFDINVGGVGPFTSPLFENNTTYYWQVIPENCSQVAQNCPVWSFTTNDGEYNFGGGGPTQNGYVFANSTSGASSATSRPTYSWIDISPTGSGTGTDKIGSIADNETIGPFPLGFSFNYFGTSYTEFYINSNGFITFSPETATFTSFAQQIPFTSNYDQDNIVAGYWKNLDPTNTNVTGKHLYYGSDNGNMVITFEKYPEVSGDADAWLTFQIILQSNGNIKFQYKEKGTSFIVDDECIGIENSDGTKGITYRYRGVGAPIFDGTSPLAIEFGSGNVNASAEIKIFLEGPYSSSSMNNSLGSSVPLTQPYSASPWSYTGSETTDLSFITTNNIVDWVYIELRTGSSAGNATTVVARRAALVKDNGVIVDTNGSIEIDFGSVNSGNYYIAVFHRNHLPIISSLPVTF